MRWSNARPIEIKASIEIISPGNDATSGEIMARRVETYRDVMKRW